MLEEERKDERSKSESISYKLNIGIRNKIRSNETKSKKKNNNIIEDM